MVTIFVRRAVGGMLSPLSPAAQPKRGYIRSMQACAPVLIVDDEADIRGLLARVLTKYGIPVVAAASAAEARGILEAQPIALVLMDVMMPGEDGLSLCAWVRQHVKVPVLLISAAASESNQTAGMQAGAAAFIQKPFEPKALVARIQGMLASGAAAGHAS